MTDLNLPKEFAELVRIPCESEADILAILSQIYDILECSIADFLQEYGELRQLPATSKATLSTIFDFVCPESCDSLSFMRQMKRFCDIIERRESDIFEYKASSLLEKLQVLELYNYDTCVDEELLNLSYSFFSKHCVSVREFADNFRALSHFLARVDPRKTPGDFVHEIIGHKVAYEENFQSSKEPAALQEIVDVLRIYYVEEEYMATRIVDYLLKLGEEARMHCAMAGRSSLLETAFAKCINNLEEFEGSVFIDGLLRYVVFGTIAEPVDSACFSQFTESIMEQDPYICTTATNCFGVDSSKLVSWLWRLFCEKHQVVNTRLLAEQETTQALDASAIEEQITKMAQSAESPVNEESKPLENHEEMESCENAFSGQEALCASKFIITGHAIIE